MIFKLVFLHKVCVRGCDETLDTQPFDANRKSYMLDTTLGMWGFAFPGWRTLALQHVAFLADLVTVHRIVRVQ